MSQYLVSRLVPKHIEANVLFRGGLAGKPAELHNVNY